MGKLVIAIVIAGFCLAAALWREFTRTTASSKPLAPDLNKLEAAAEQDHQVDMVSYDLTTEKYEQLTHKRDMAAYAVVDAAREHVGTLGSGDASPLSDLIADYDQKKRELHEFGMTPEFREAKQKGS
jgi:hypothetical protein